MDPVFPFSLHENELDIVIRTTGNLDFLEMWRPFFHPYHLIIIQDGDQTKKINVPNGYNYDLYNHKYINTLLGVRSSCIPFNDSASRCFGYLMANKKYVFTIDDDCIVAKDPNGKEINPVEQHINNLLTPSTPFFFNTLYNPYQEGADVAYGYPGKLLEGVPTAVSHGLWLDFPDYDSLTQHAKPHQRNTRYVDAVMTIPKGTLFSMSGMNVSFNRELIGPAMYSGLMGDCQPVGRFDDLWTGFCVKVICDHLGLGVKTGLPYISHRKVSDTCVIQTDELKGLNWLELLVQFFQTVTFPEDCTTVQKCYIELSQQVRLKLYKVDVYFRNLADAMLTWIEAWNNFQPSPRLLNPPDFLSTN